MQASLKFNLPDEQYEFDVACKGQHLKAALQDLALFLRDKIKYADIPVEETRVYEKVREELFNILACNGLSLD